MSKPDGSMMGIALVDFMGSNGWCVPEGPFPEGPFPEDLNERVYEKMEFFFRHELMPFIGFVPDFGRILENGVNMVVAVKTDGQ